MSVSSDVVDPTSLTVSAYDQRYPSPPMSDDVEPSVAGSDDRGASKKKRKAWGQPVPEIKQILPPRKRAKTAEEKEQRKNERILRNRRAADKSRQRQKAAVAELEVRQVRIEQENAALRDLLARYQSRFGVQADFPHAVAADASAGLTDAAAPSPLDLDAVAAASPFTQASSYADVDVDSVQPQPTLVPCDSTTPTLKLESPALAPQLKLIDGPADAEPSREAPVSFASFPTVSGVTQYPAVILCDLQCQPETWAMKLPALGSASCGLSYLLQAFQAWTIFHTFSTTTLWPICTLFQILAQRLSMTSTEQDFSSILTNFPLIHSLISMPSTPTRPAVFRMKLLSRLLACSPHMARLLLAATDRALQQVVSDDAFAEDPDRRWTWSSLMTIKWTILRLEREHRRIRRQVWTTPGDAPPDLVLMAGVDRGAVARSSQLWQGGKSHCTSTTVPATATGPDRWRQVQEVR